MTVTTVVRVAMAVVGLGCLAGAWGGIARSRRRRRHLPYQAAFMLATFGVVGVGLVSAAGIGALT